MTNPIVREHNQETGEIIDREMTDAEVADMEAELDKRAEEKAKIEAAAQAKAILLERLGITDEEAKLLLG